MSLLSIGNHPAAAEPAPAVVPACTWSDGAVVRGPVDAKRIALVFTAHSFAEGSDAILAALKRHGAKASFFVTGVFLDEPEFAPVLRRIVAEGHYLGPHSDQHLLLCDWTPARTRLVSRDAFAADLDANRRKLARFTGEPARWYLPPYEHHDADVARWSEALGVRLVNLTAGTRSAADYTPESARNFVPSDAIVRSVLEREQTDPHGLNGYVLLFHLGAGPERHDKMHAKFGALLDALAERGYEFVRIDALLAAHPPAPEVFIRLNQVGYRPGEPKIALAFAAAPLAERFTVESVADGRTVFTGQTRLVPSQKWGRFEHHAEADFSALDAAGTYALTVGGAKSAPFAIGIDAGRQLPAQELEFMREQRCGYNPWLRAECHQEDGRTAYGPLPSGTKVDARGGWHDAADLLKYQLTSGNATAQMLLAYAIADDKGAFEDRVDARGEAAPNGRPDILDEARWGLEWLLKLHPSPDALYHQVADDRDHIGLRLPQNETADYGWGGGGARVVYFADGQPQGLGKFPSDSNGVANLAGRYAAAMALAYQIWKDDPRERAFAERCLQAGREVYALGLRQPGVQQGNSVRAPYRYEETTWADDMEWGAAELARATGDARFIADGRRFARLAAADTWMGREQTKHYQYYPFLNVGHYRLHALVEPAFQHELAGYYRTGLAACAAAAHANPYGVGVPFIWCSNNLVVALVTQANLYERMTGETAYREFAARQRDWLFGRNPWGTTMFMHVGSVCPTDVHLQTTKLTGRQVAGGLVDGPVYGRIFKSLRGVTITEPDPLAAFQDERAVYHNDYHDYSTNEPTMDGTASALLMWATEH